MFQCLLIPTRDFTNESKEGYKEIKNNINDLFKDTEISNNYIISAPFSLRYPKMDLSRFIMMRTQHVPSSPYNAYKIFKAKMQLVDEKEFTGKDIIKGFKDEDWVKLISEN